MGAKIAWVGVAIELAGVHFIPGLQIVGDLALIAGAILICIDK